MCGVYGVVNHQGLSDHDTKIVESIGKHVLHRGPDQQSILRIDDFSLFGNNRLAIIDVNSPSQPITCKCRKHTLTFNGEIYNYKELRAMLNYEFETSGDSETLLAVLCKLGIQAIEMLKGQFAFALWDSENQELTLATDRFGIIPLHLKKKCNQILFSSSASSLLPEKQNREPYAIKSFITKRFIEPPQTFYNDVTRIPPGEIWIFKNSKFTRKKWHVPNYETMLSIDRNSYPGLKKELKFLITQAANRVVTSDVEMGVFLSSGIDSSLAAYLLSERLDYPLRSYTAIWPADSENKERVSAANNARILGLLHTEVEISSSDWLTTLLNVSRFRDGPIAEPADIAYYLLSKRAAQDVKVVVTGEGADELFAGYKKYQVEYLLQFRAFRTFVRLCRPFRNMRSSERIDRLFDSALIKSNAGRYSSYFSTNWNSEYLTGMPTVMNCDISNGVDGLRIWDLENYLPNILLERADRMTMANSLESRPLFLDNDLADFALKLKISRKLLHGRGKTLFREVANDFLPGEYMHVSKKGFPMPIGKWFSKDIHEFLRELLLVKQNSLDSYVQKKDISALLDEQRRNPNAHTYKLFTLLSLAVWLEGENH